MSWLDYDSREFEEAMTEAHTRAMEALGARYAHDVWCFSCGHGPWRVEAPLRTRATTTCPSCGAVRWVAGSMLP